MKSGDLVMVRCHRRAPVHVSDPSSLTYNAIYENGIVGHAENLSLGMVLEVGSNYTHSKVLFSDKVGWVYNGFITRWL